MKKTSLKALVAIVLTLALALSIVGCGNKEAKLKEIKLNTNTVATEFRINDPFSYSGLKVTAVYEDGKTENVSARDYKVTAPDMSTVGEKTVTVTYKDLSATYKVKIMDPNEAAEADWKADYNIDPSKEKLITLSALKAYLIDSGAGRLGPSDIDPEVSVGGMVYDDKVVFRFQSAAAGKAKLSIDFDHSGHGNSPVKNLIEFTFNRAKVETEAVFNNGADGHVHENWKCYQKTLIGEIDVVEGKNTLVMRFIGNGSNLKSVILDFGATPVEPEKPDPKPEGEVYRFEAENAMLYKCMTEYKAGVGASGDALVGDTGAEARQVITVYAADKVTVKIKFRIASGATTLESLVSNFKINDKTVDLSGISVPGGSGPMWYNWTVATVENVSLDKGKNTLSMSVNGNFDYIEITSKVKLYDCADGEKLVKLDGTKASIEGSAGAEEGHEGWLNNIAVGDKVTFAFTATDGADAMLSLFVDHQNSLKPDVSSMLEITVNGVKLETEARYAYCGAGCPDAGHHAIEVKLGEIKLKANNTITVKFLTGDNSNFNGIGLRTSSVIA